MDILLFAIGSIVAVSITAYIMWAPVKFIENTVDGYKRG